MNLRQSTLPEGRATSQTLREISPERLLSCSLFLQIGIQKQPLVQKLETWKYNGVASGSIELEEPIRESEQGEEKMFKT